MTDSQTVIQRYDQFTAKLTALVDEYKDAIAPDWDRVENMPCSHEDDCECKPNDNIVPTDFVLIVNWTDFDKSRTHITGCPSSHLMPWQIVGLLEVYRDRFR
jgi:hypothetical protein